MTSTVTITLLTQEQCPLCDHAKALLERVRNDPSSPATVNVVVVDLASAEGKRLGAAAGVLFAPGVLLDGQPFSHGRLSERKLRRALALSDRPRQWGSGLLRSPMW